VRGSDGGVVGEAAVDFIRQFKVDYAVIGASAIDHDGALLDFDERSKVRADGEFAGQLELASRVFVPYWSPMFAKAKPSHSFLRIGGRLPPSIAPRSVRRSTPSHLVRNLNDVIWIV